MPAGDARRPRHDHETNQSSLPLLLFVASTAAAQQSGLLRITFQAESRIASPIGFTYGVHVEWTGKEPAQDITLEVDVPGAITSVNAHGLEMQCTSSKPVRCTMPQLKAQDQFSGMSISVRFPGAGTYTAHATATSGNPSATSSATHTLEVAGLPELWGSVISNDETVDPGAQGTLRWGVSNNGDTATNVVVRARVEDGGAILNAGPGGYSTRAGQISCSVENGEAVCRVAKMEFVSFAGFELVYWAPDRRQGGKVVITSTVQADQADFDPSNDTFGTEVPLRRMFVVTSALDEGPDTLRQAILDSRSQCEAIPCTIAFEGVPGIQPLHALPHLRGRMRIDGRDVPLVIDGARVDAGDALHYEGGCGFDVRRLEIRNFPGHGIDASQSDADRSACNWAPGELSVWRTVLSNNERGIVAKGIDASLRENVVSGHRRAGIFIDNSYYAAIYNNVVVNNGASGIYVNPANVSRYTIASGADLVENIVHGNGEWGIVRTGNGIVQMRRNSTIRNGLYGVDAGLDLATPNRADDTTGVPNEPVIESATYDAATNVTTIRATATTSGAIDLYASTSLSRYGYPESEFYIGTAWVSRERPAEVRVDRDLRGLWITGTVSRGHTLYFLRSDAAPKPRTDLWRPSGGFDTSELSEAVQVQ